MLHLKAFLIGIPTALLVLVLLAGPENAYLILLILVVCTAGLGLIPLLLVCYLTGLLLLGAYSVGKQVVGSNQTDSLAGHIRKARAAGKSDRDIELSLSRVGWSQQEIQEAERRSASSGAR